MREQLLQQIYSLKEQLDLSCQNDNQQQMRQISSLFLQLKQYQKVPLQELEQLKEILYRAQQAMHQEQLKKNKYKKTDLESFREIQKQEGFMTIPLLDRIVIEKQGDERVDPLDLSLDLLGFTNQQLCGMALEVLESQDLLQPFGISNTIMQNLMQKISMEYNVVPFHNYTHAYQVFQLSAYCFQKSKKVKQYFSKLEMFAAYVAAISHDMNHKGVSNSYHQKKKSDKFVLYSGQSVLENMHSAKFFRLMLDKEINILNDFKPTDLAIFKDIFVSSILSTDMSNHNKLVDKFIKMIQCNQLLEEHEVSQEIEKILKNKSLDLELPVKRKFFMNVLVHAADIGNPTLPYERYINWSYLVSQEFQQQYNKEVKHNLPLTQMYQYNGEEGFYSGQLFFVNTFVLPLWKQIGGFFGNLEIISINIEKNINILEEKVKKVKEIQ